MFFILALATSCADCPDGYAPWRAAAPAGASYAQCFMESKSFAALTKMVAGQGTGQPSVHVFAMRSQPPYRLSALATWHELY